MTDDRARHATRGRPVANQPDRPAGRVPPSNLDAEASLLGAAMISPDALEVLATRTEPGDFYKPGHGHVAAVLRHAFEQGQAVDSVTVGEELTRRGLLESVGGPAFVAGLMATAPATSNAARYATIVHDLATLRRLLAAGAEISELGYGSRADDAHDVILRAQALLGGVASQNGSRSYSSLDVADVAALLDGDLTTEEPDFLRRNDGRALLYGGKMHVLQAEPSSGKSWLALLAALEVLAMGGAVVYLDYEDTSVGILGRLLALGADPAAVRHRFRYIQPSGPFGPTERVELSRLCKTLNPDLIVIDGVAEALVRDGYAEDRAAEVVAWVEALPRWLARTGAAVLMLDHVVKNREEQGRWARGSGAKLGAVDGSAYLVKVVVPFSRTRAGRLRLVIAKDRPGGVGAIGDTAAIVDIEPKADGTRVLMRLTRDTGEVSANDTWKPTVLMRRCADELAKAPDGLSATALKSLVHSDKPKLVTEAISRLIVERYVVEARAGRSKVLRLIRPYADGGDPGPTEPPRDDPALFDPDHPTDNVVRGPWPEGEEEF